MKAKKSNLIESVLAEVIEPAIQRQMETPYFTELRSGKLSRRRIQGWALQHYLYNRSITQGFVVCMLKYSHDQELYNAFAAKFVEERQHPSLVKSFGLTMGLKEEDFEKARPILENVAHMSVVLRNNLASPMDTRTSAFTNETILTRSCEQFNIYLRKHYGLDDKGCQFFTLHSAADEDHVKDGANYILRHVTPQEEQVVYEVADWISRLNIMKFNGIYEAYA